MNQKEVLDILWVCFLIPEGHIVDRELSYDRGREDLQGPTPYWGKTALSTTPWVEPLTDLLGVSEFSSVWETGTDPSCRPRLSTSIPRKSRPFANDLRRHLRIRDVDVWFPLFDTPGL